MFNYFFCFTIMTNIFSIFYIFVNQFQSLVNDMLTACALVFFIVISGFQILFQN